MSGRQRNIRIHLRVTEHEKKLIDQKMKELGTKNMEAYLRKMAIDGFIIHLDTADVRELVKVLRITSNSLNQLTKRAHETGNLISRRKIIHMFILAASNTYKYYLFLIFPLYKTGYK